MSEGELYGDDVKEFTVKGTIFLPELAILMVRDVVSSGGCCTLSLVISSMAG